MPDEYVTLDQAAANSGLQPAFLRWQVRIGGLGNYARGLTPMVKLTEFAALLEKLGIGVGMGLKSNPFAMPPPGTPVEMKGRERTDPADPNDDDWHCVPEGWMPVGQ